VLPEKARYARYDLARSKRQLLLSRAMLRTVLARYVEDEVLQISLGAHGRPQLVGESGLSFNLSHSRDRVVVAVTRLGVVGVDVEYAARQRRVEQLIARYFSQREQSALLALPESSRLPRFYALWALKEAYIKARGLGLAIPLADFSFSFAEDAGASEAHVKPQGSVSISFEGSLAAQSPTPWRFWRGALAGEEYAFGLALHSSGGLTWAGISRVMQRRATNNASNSLCVTAMPRWDSSIGATLSPAPNSMLSRPLHHRKSRWVRATSSLF
jgi:phosphopantetheine--protein transferase-like protein